MLATLTDCPNESALLAAILADATNLGLSRMAAASQGVTRDQLVWTQDAYVREDTHRAALATIINASIACRLLQCGATARRRARMGSLGPIRLTNALIDHLAIRQNAVIVNVSSGLAFVPPTVRTELTPGQSRRDD